MNKYFTENGFLSEDGKKLVEEFNSGLVATLNQAGAKNMSEAEIRTLGCNLGKILGDTISNLLQTKSDSKNSFSVMTDEQFEAHLKNKYGARWMLVSVTKEEFDRVKIMVTMSDEKMKEAWEEAREAALSHVSQVIDSGLRFR